MRDLREARVAAGPDELAALETDVFAGFVLARAAAGLADATIVSDVINLEQIRVWFGRPLWEMEPPDADAYFGKVLRSAAKGTRQARSRALRVYFLFLEIRHKVEIHQLTGRVVECPIDERQAIHAASVRDPVLPATRSNATISVAGSCTKLNRSSNRRPGSATAQR